MPRHDRIEMACRLIKKTGAAYVLYFGNVEGSSNTPKQVMRVPKKVAILFSDGYRVSIEKQWWLEHGGGIHAS